MDSKLVSNLLNKFNTRQSYHKNFELINSEFTSEKILNTIQMEQPHFKVSNAKCSKIFYA